MSLMTQAKLLRVLQEGEVTPVGSSERKPVDVRIISATGKNLLEEIGRGAFREDLYHRINVLTIAVPPLRTRREDIPELAEHFLRLSSVENGLTPKRLTPRAVDFLGQLPWQPWQGNVRELRNLMERLSVLIPKDVVGHDDVMAALHMPGASTDEGGALPLRQARARFEKQYILHRLSVNRGNLGHTARDLGIERTNLYRKMKQLGIRSPQNKARV
jgi:two-component system nitrogen regulation response regulator NtrX